MTISTPDTLRLSGFVYLADASEALAAYFAAQALTCGPSLPAPDSEYADGYRSTWEIRNDRLYFMQLNLVDQSKVFATTRCLPIGGAEGLLAQWFKGAIYVDDAKVHVEEANLDPLRPRPVVALHFERGIFGDVWFLM